MSPTTFKGIDTLCRRSLLNSSESSRYQFFENGLKGLVKHPLFINLPAIYPADYKQDELTPSKWNWNIPIAIREKYKHSFGVSMALQSERREIRQGFSFSDFVFRDLDKRIGIRFTRANDTNVTWLQQASEDDLLQLNVEVHIKREIPVRIESECGSDELVINRMTDLRSTPLTISWEEVRSSLNPVEELRCKLLTALADRLPLISDKVSYLTDVATVIVSSLAMPGIHGYQYLPSVTGLEECGAGKTQERSSGGFIVPFFDQVVLSTDQERALTCIAQSWFAQTAIVDIAQRESRAVKKEAMRAAISRVIARSTSHNLGSHSLQLLSDADELQRAFNPSGRTACTDLSNAFRYLKDRMEMQAQIATTTSGVLQTITLNDVRKEFEKAKLLIDRMVKPGFLVTLSVGSTVSELQCGLPEGPMGLSALFNLFENIIRNADRHTQWKGGLFELIHDEACDKDGLFCLELQHEWKVNEPDRALADIKSALEREMMDPVTGKLRNGGWGMLEMKLICAYLRQIDLAKVDDKSIKPPLLEVSCKDPDEQAQEPRLLRYRFYLHKPKDLLRAVKVDGEWSFMDSAGNRVLQEHCKQFPIMVMGQGDLYGSENHSLPVRRVRVTAPAGISAADAWRAYVEEMLSSMCMQVDLRYADNGTENAKCTVGDGGRVARCIVDKHLDEDVLDNYIHDGLASKEPHLIQGLPSDKLIGCYRSEIEQDIRSQGQWAYRLAEATVLPVVILDERIQKATQRDDYRNKAVRALGIYQPDAKKEADLDAIDLSWTTVKAYLKSLCERWRGAGMSEFHLVIHRTVLVKLFENAEAGFEALRELGFHVYWTSGAAAAEEYDNKVPYVPFAMLERTILEEQCKWQLIDLLKHLQLHP